MAENALTVAIGSLGAIGYKVAAELTERGGAFRLTAVSARDRDRAEERMRSLGSTASIVPLTELPLHADIVVECAPPKVFRDIAEPTIEMGRTFVPATAGGLLGNPDLFDLARKTNARIVVPTGAIAGLDAVRAVSRGRVETATLTTRKSPRSLAGAPYLVETGFDPETVAEPTCVFRENTYEAARAFPANVNIAAALALAGIGPERTTVEIWADPGAARNAHTISVVSDAARLELVIEVYPSHDNPRSSTLTPLSILAALDSLVDSIRIGS